MFGTKAKPEPRTYFRVVRRPTWDELGSYEIVDPYGRVVQTEYDLMVALEAARYMNEHLGTRRAA